MKNALRVEDQEGSQVAETTDCQVAGRPGKPRDDQASWLVDCLYYNNPRLAPTRDQSEAGTSDAGSLHTVWADTHKAKGREDTQATVNPPRRATNQKTAAGCEGDEADIREAVLHELNDFHGSVSGSDGFSHVADCPKDDSQV